jgi:hypothetical protein
VTKKYGFNWRKAKGSAPVRQGESAQSRPPQVRVQTPAAADEAQAVPGAVSEEPRLPHERIAVCAYGLWEAQGRPERADLGNWFDAERRLHSEAR